VKGVKDMEEELMDCEEDEEKPLQKSIFMTKGSWVRFGMDQRHSIKKLGSKKI